MLGASDEEAVRLQKTAVVKKERDFHVVHRTVGIPFKVHFQVVEEMIPYRVEFKELLLVLLRIIWEA